MANTLYRQISDNNRVRYGTDAERILRIIINQYSDRTHFIYEILQNAEDAGATHIEFHLERSRFVIYHNGRPFDEKDIEGVCGIANGTKEDGTRIGHFGIGFKSVYCYTECPHIYSASYHFVIKNQLFPEETAAIPGLPASETCMILPFDKHDVSPEVSYQEIRNALLRNITAESLLMLNHIVDVGIRIDGVAEQIDINKQKYALDRDAYPDNVFSLSVETTRRNQNTGKEIYHNEDYLFFTDASKEAAAIIFKVEEKELKPVKNSMIYAFFPTAKEAHQNFYIHAPFDTTPARDNFKEGAEYGKHNIQLVKNIGELIWFALAWMRDHHYLSVTGFHNVFPIYEYEPDNILYGIYKNSIDIISEEAIIPTSVTGEFKKISEVCIPLWGNIVDTFDVSDLRRLRKNRNLSWISKEITTEAFSDLRSFLNSNFKLETLDWKDLVQNIDGSFLIEKDLTWMERLTSRIESYCTRRTAGDSHFIDVSAIPFVRTARREQVCARDAGGKLQVYLNNPEIATYAIEPSFLKNESIRSFYQRALGIPEYNVEQEALENILPKYTSSNPRFKTRAAIRENIEDLKTIKDAIYTNPLVLEKVSDKYIVTDGKSWYKPSELYIYSQDTRTGYSLVRGIISIKYLSERYFDGSLLSLKLDEDFFKKIGCNYGIRTLTVSRDEYLQAVKKYCGAQMCSDLRFRIFNKTYISKKLNWSFNFEGFPEVFNNITKEKSLAIARFLNPAVEQFSIQGDLVGADDQHYSGKNVDSMVAYSMLGLQLCFIPWIYINGDSNPHRPLDIDESDILPEYKRGAKRLIAILPFKEVKSALSEWLSETIENKKDQDLVKRLLSNPEELIKLANAKARSDAKAAAKAEGGKSIADLLADGDKKQEEPGKRNEGLEIAPISEKAKERREKKLDEEFAKSMDQFTRVARGLSFARRESSPEERLFLLQEYDGVCQICLKQITKYNGEPYFEAINIIQTSSLHASILPTIQFGWNSLCLCPNCAAEYNNCSKKISTLHEQVMQKTVEPDSEEAISVDIELPEGKRKSIKYSPRHFLALQRAFIAFSEE